MEVNLIKLQEGLETSINFTCAMILSKCLVTNMHLEKGNKISATPLLVELHNYMFLLKNLLVGVNVTTLHESTQENIIKIEDSVNSFDKIMKGE